MSCTEAIACLPQIITLRGCEKRMRGTKGYKGHDASTVAAAVGEKAHLGTKRC